MRLLNCSIVFFIISITLPSEAHRILGLFPSNAKSHFVMFERLMKALAERGHQVDIVGHFPLKKPFPNYTDVINLAGSLPDVVNNVTIDSFEKMQTGGSPVHHLVAIMGSETCDLMGRPELQDFIKNPPKNPPYDLIIAEVFSHNCYLAMGQHLNVPVVGLVSSTLLPWTNGHFANPDNPAYVPNVLLNANPRMNFWERLVNTVVHIKVNWDFYQASAALNEAIQKYIGPHAPTVWEAERNVSLLLVNSHYSLNGVRPFTTAIVEVGGLHIDEKGATLPKDLQKWLDDSKDGVVYISFGSMLKIESLAKKTLAALYASLAKLAPVRVLMKIAKPEELPPGLPSNVLTQPWIPQSAVLKHKNIRAFMTHGGLMGTQEAIYYGVPMIGVPFFGDQSQNINLYERLHIAVALDYKKLTEDTLDTAFRTVLHDPSYMKAVKRVSELFRDRPMSALDTAIFWVEYVMRHGGTHIRSPAMDLAWWQIALCDVFGFLFLSVILVACLIIAAVKKLKRVFYPSKARSTTQSKKVK